MTDSSSTNSQDAGAARARAATRRRQALAGAIGVVVLTAAALAASCSDGGGDAAPDGNEATSARSNATAAARDATAAGPDTTPAGIDAAPVGTDAAAEQGDARGAAPTREAVTVTPQPMHPPPVEAARARYASELGVDPVEISVDAYEAVDWRDSSLGCARPGEMYLQVITPGYRVALSHDGEQAVYHTDLRDPPAIVRCDRSAGSDAGALSPGSSTK
ncbi:MAG: hypothetical protein ACK2T6_07825 [Anaerolineae bacterium]